jgi:UDP-glucose:glycoprotein glucosyltransferase
MPHRPHWALCLAIRLKRPSRPSHSLLRILRKERKIVSSITSLGLSAPQAIDILSHRAVGASSGPPPAGRGFLSLEALGELFDASDARESAEAGTILYWNDIERDSRYRNWPRSLQALLQPMYPGQLPQIRRNAINVVLVMDLSKRDNHAILADNVATFIQRGVGIRFGMVPLLQDTAEHTDLGQIVSKTMWYLVEKAGRAGALAFSRDVSRSLTPVLLRKNGAGVS